ncbi:MAG: nitrite/sulfite reductase [Pseudomonadales bacterium]|jgi:sulfite reductase (NADPH) hemoprotein beta-component
MYRYRDDETDLVLERIEEFEDQIARRLSGELSEDAFKPLRLMNGLYLQLHAYMLRVAIPYGTLDTAQLRALAHIAERFDRGYGHFTTRQNLQFNWIALTEVPEILRELAKVGLHAIQTSGNCIRNITADPFAGAAADELEDSRPWAELLRQWSTFHPEFSFLPRKFKIAVNGAREDRTALRFHDIGLQWVKGPEGTGGFEVWVGGGQGRTPRVGRRLRTFLAPEHLLSYLTAVLRVYNTHGRRDNLYKARIKILVDSLGLDAFREEVEACWESLPKDTLHLPEGERDRVKSFFPPPPAAEDAPVPLLGPPAFVQWLKVNRQAHQRPGLASVVVSLKPIGGTPGDATAAQMTGLADLVDRYGFGELRVSPEQNLILPHVRNGDLLALWEGLSALGLATANHNLSTDIVACPGLDYCNLANARAIPLAQTLSESIENAGLGITAGLLRIKLSGCINACGHHHIADLGILGVDKRGEEFYQITLGGRAGEEAAVGEITGPSLAADAVTPAVLRVLRAYLALRNPGEPFASALQRLGHDPFKEALYDRSAA